MTAVHSIIHSSKVEISLPNQGSEGQPAVTHGILALFASSQVLRAVSDDHPRNNVTVNLPPAAEDYRSRALENVMSDDSDRADTATAFVIQVGMVHQPKNTFTASNKGAVVSYKVQFSLKQIASTIKMALNSVEQYSSTPQHHDSDSSMLQTDAVIELQKLKHLISLFKHTTTEVNQPSLDDEPIASSFSKYFITFRLMPHPQHTLTDDDGIYKSTLDISIKERLPNTMVRIVWSSILSCVDDNNHSDASTTTMNPSCNSSAAELLELSLRLTEQHQEIMRGMRAEHEQYRLLLRERDGWKDTAQKLEGKWEDEKSVLFQNFCTLYTGKQDYDQAIIHQMQAEINALKDQGATMNATAPAIESALIDKKATKSAELPECLQDVPQDDHKLVYDDDLVRRLARGERVPMEPTIRPEQYASPAEIPTSTTTTAHQRKRHHNPISGATEYMDADDALKDIHAPNTTTQSAPQPVRTTKRNKTASNTKAKVPPIRAVASKIEMGEVSEPTITPGKSNTDNDAGSDDDFVDKGMEAQIMADLEALRKL